MSVSKSKKRRKRKAVKKKNLPIIDPEFIKANQCWIPKKYKNKYDRPTDSWFDNIATHEYKPSTKAYNEGETTTLRAERIDLFPTPEQKVKLLDWLETYRRLYNLTITHRSKFMNKGNMIGYHKLRTIIQRGYLPNSNLHKEIHKLYLPASDRLKNKVPAHCIWNAIHDVCKSFKTAKANKDAGNIKSFRLRHKKQSNPKRTLVIEPKSFSTVKNGFAITALGEMKSSKPFGYVNHECRLSYNSDTGKFVLWKPVDKVTAYNRVKRKIISLDPGLRTFQNGYSPGGICHKFGTEKTLTKIKVLFKKIDNVKKDKISRVGNKCNYKIYTKRIRRKITDMVADLHWKTANYLCKNFKTILVGNMSTTGIVKQNKSVLNAFQKRLIISLSHYEFRLKLTSKAEKYGTKCLIVDESFTTKTCGKCGQQNQKVGGAKIFKCPIESCGFVLDRDYNAGRNIYLKALSNRLIKQSV
jgi:putative transposase